MKLSIYDATKTVCGGNRNFQSSGEIESAHEFEFCRGYHKEIYLYDILLHYIEYSTMPKQAELKINTIGEVSVCFFAFIINCKINIIKSIISPLMSKEIGNSNCCILKTVLKNNIMDVDKIKPITHGLMPLKKA